MITQIRLPQSNAGIGPRDRGNEDGAAERLRTAQRRYREGVRRSLVYHDLVADDIRGFGTEPTVLDIGCGGGFNDEPELQESLSKLVGRFIGIEPDPSVPAAPWFDQHFHSTLEEARLAGESVHLAYSVFVLEHIRDANSFWQKLYEVLVPGGIFWGFTVDRRHPFSAASRLMDVLKVKDRYLNRIQGERGTERYANYPTWYRANSPGQVAKHAIGFEHVLLGNFHKPGQLRYYVPRILWPVSDAIDWLSIHSLLPGSVLAIRLKKDAVRRP